MSKKILDELSRKQLLVVTGKGGTGKSVVSVALAYRFAEAGKKVWLIELGRKQDRAFSRLHEFLELDEPLHHKAAIVPTGNLPGLLWASRIDPTESLAEYVGLKLPGGHLASLLLNNRVTSSFLEIVPGLPELVSLGKLWFHLTEKANPQPDMIIIDGPASGHGITFLHTPTNFAKLTKAGPIHKDALAMEAFLEDKTKTAVLFTSLPEEMSLLEAWEHQAFLPETDLPLLFVNKCFPELASPPKKLPEEIFEAAEYTHTRNTREQETLKNFRKEHKNWPLLEIPFFFPEPDAPALAKRIWQEAFQ